MLQCVIIFSFDLYIYFRTNLRIILQLQRTRTIAQGNKNLRYN